MYESGGLYVRLNAFPRVIKGLRGGPQEQKNTGLGKGGGVDCARKVAFSRMKKRQSVHHQQHTGAKGSQ